MTQILQYGARFFYWWFATTDPALSQRAFKLYRTTQRSRKAFRMLKVISVCLAPTSCEITLRSCPKNGQQTNKRVQKLSNRFKAVIST